MKQNKLEKQIIDLSDEIVLSKLKTRIMIELLKEEPKYLWIIQQIKTLEKIDRR